VVDEEALTTALKRHWDYGGTDQDIAHEIYHDDAVLEFRSPASGSRAWRTSGSGDASIRRP
jgi:hypothetical protein